ncbi:MAG: trypsin-like peptidase domain-containing protein [Micromonosporaceae bacterium]
MREHENEREQDPAYGTGGEQPPSDGASIDQPPTFGAAGEPPAYGATGEGPAYGATGEQPPQDGTGGQHTDAFWTGGYQPPSYGSGADQPPGYGSGAQYPSGYGAGEQHTQAFAVGGQQPPAYSESWQSPGGGWPPPPSGPYGPWGTPPSPSPRRGRRAVAFAAVAILGVGIGAVAAVALTRGSGPASSGPGAGAVPTPGSERAPLHNTDTSKINASAIAQSVSPSVADVTSKIKYTSETAEGTGIVISSSGLVLTNNHVVNGATRVTAQIDGTGPVYTARVLGTDSTHDVALLQLVGASRLKAAAMGDSSKVAIGDSVVALGNEGGQGGTPTVTKGAITNLNRKITAGDQGTQDTETLYGMLQTDAHIGSGDSGGPLVNASGQVIGMDTAAATSGLGQSESIGFAIPINHALSIARQIAAGQGSSTVQIGLPAFLGVRVCPSIAGAAQCLSDGAAGFGNTRIAPVKSGALVQTVLPGTPAQSAGITSGDVIIRLDGRAVTSARSLTKAMRSHRPGQSVPVTWVDGSGQRHTANVTLMTGPAN